MDSLVFFCHYRFRYYNYNFNLGSKQMRATEIGASQIAITQIRPQSIQIDNVNSQQAKLKPKLNTFINQNLQQCTIQNQSRIKRRNQNRPLTSKQNRSTLKPSPAGFYPTQLMPPPLQTFFTVTTPNRPKQLAQILKKRSSGYITSSQQTTKCKQTQTPNYYLSMLSKFQKKNSIPHRSSQNEDDQKYCPHIVKVKKNNQRSKTRQNKKRATSMLTIDSSKQQQKITLSRICIEKDIKSHQNQMIRNNIKIII